MFFFSTLLNIYRKIRRREESPWRSHDLPIGNSSPPCQVTHSLLQTLSAQLAKLCADGHEEVDRPSIGLSCGSPCRWRIRWQHTVRQWEEPRKKERPPGDWSRSPLALTACAHHFLINRLPQITSCHRITNTGIKCAITTLCYLSYSTAWRTFSSSDPWSSVHLLDVIY